MIDNDYDVLYQLVKDEMLEDNITFEQYIGNILKWINYYLLMKSFLL